MRTGNMLPPAEFVERRASMDSDAKSIFIEEGAVAKPAAAATAARKVGHLSGGSAEGHPQYPPSSQSPQRIALAIAKRVWLAGSNQMR